MNLEATIRRIWNEARPERRTAVLRTGLRLFSLGYRSAVAARNILYDRGILRQERLPCPVISVGNLTVGGTGKTPTVILLANRLRDLGRRPAVLSRGYGGSAKAPVSVVSDGNRILLGWREAGDEPILIARLTPGVPVLTGPRRFLTGQTAVEKFGADLLILDDAFQHRALFRNLDIVLVDAARPFANGFLLPRGALREPPEALRRAHVVIRTGAGEGSGEPLIEALSLPAFRGIHRPLALAEADTQRDLPLSELHGQQVCAFAGIGRPEAFRRSLAGLGAEVVSFRAFPDHHPYTPADLEALMRLAGKRGAGRLVTTEKDAVRLTDFPDFLPHVSFLRIGMEISPAEPFTGLILSRLTCFNENPPLPPFDKGGNNKVPL